MSEASYKTVSNGTGWCVLAAFFIALCGISLVLPKPPFANTQPRVDTIKNLQVAKPLTLQQIELQIQAQGIAINKADTTFQANLAAVIAAHLANDDAELNSLLILFTQMKMRQPNTDAK